MKILQLSALVLLIALASCSSKKNNSTDNQDTTKNTETANTTESRTNESATKTNTTNTSDNAVYGYYTGGFTPVDFDATNDVYHTNKITISVDSINADEQMMYGHSIVAGNKRPFKGKYQVTDSGYVAKVDEPGDDPYDGAFSFTVSKDGQKLKGTWAAFKKKNLSASTTKYELEKRKFAYQSDLQLPEGVQWNMLYDHSQIKQFTNTGERLTSDVLKLNASKDMLKKEDIENMYKGDLEVIRNAIYARHGYSFKNRKMRFVFDYIKWYMPISTDVRGQLTELEKKNIELLKRYEQHSARYYDTFGR